MMSTCFNNYISFEENAHVFNEMFSKTSAENLFLVERVKITYSGTNQANPLTLSAPMAILRLLQKYRFS